MNKEELKKIEERIKPKQGETNEEYLERVAPKFMKGLKAKRAKELNDKTMIAVLQSLCHKTGWFKFDAIAKQFRANMHPQTFNNYEISAILDNVGFNIKRRRGDRVYVFISHEALIRRD